MFGFCSHPQVLSHITLIAVVAPLSGATKNRVNVLPMNLWFWLIDSTWFWICVGHFIKINCGTPSIKMQNVRCTVAYLRNDAGRFWVEILESKNDLVRTKEVVRSMFSLSKLQRHIFPRQLMTHDVVFLDQPWGISMFVHQQPHMLGWYDDMSKSIPWGHLCCGLQFVVSNFPVAKTPLGWFLRVFAPTSCVVGHQRLGMFMIHAHNCSDPNSACIPA